MDPFEKRKYLYSVRIKFKPMCITLCTEPVWAGDNWHWSFPNAQPLFWSMKVVAITSLSFFIHYSWSLTMWLPIFTFQNRQPRRWQISVLTRMLYVATDFMDCWRSEGKVYRVKLADFFVYCKLRYSPSQDTLVLPESFRLGQKKPSWVSLRKSRLLNLKFQSLIRDYLLH